MTLGAALRPRRGGAGCAEPAGRGLTWPATPRRQLLAREAAQWLPPAGLTCRRHRAASGAERSEQGSASHRSHEGPAGREARYGAASLRLPVGSRTSTAAERCRGGPALLRPRPGRRGRPRRRWLSAGGGGGAAAACRRAERVARLPEADRRSRSVPDAQVSAGGCGLRRPPAPCVRRPRARGCGGRGARRSPRAGPDSPAAQSGGAPQVRVAPPRAERVPRGQ
ncbi:uncharacterized protein C10orf95-like [Falco rusticolus]|uniref:uncharacterized protein C10orf95-like n=1 Tax=Falco rusticolus TaxID=120794 RepID=UPI0018866A68|nr:uncharacterized protein C10orf95-like [Falco rusticolus]XP_055560799.1 uncharacterized protein C10orf95-like [Falco cherrug]